MPKRFSGKRRHNLVRKTPGATACVNQSLPQPVRSVVTSPPTHFRFVSPSAALERLARKYQSIAGLSTRIINNMATGTVTTLGQLPRTIEDFGVHLHKNLANKIQGNFVSSALSAHIVLSMAAYGAGGITAEEMRSALRLPKNDEEAYRGFQEFITSLDNVSNVTLKVANKIYSSSLLKLKDKFKNLSSTHFGSESESLDFSKSNAVDIINKWCSEQTNGKIQDIIKPEQLGVDMKLVLLNAVYFKGNWKKQFVRERTSLAPFYTNETTTVEVPMMNVVDKFHYKELSELDAECLILPYANEDVNMIIILPKKVDGLKYVENNLEKFSFNYETDLKHYKLKIDLSLPKFKIISDINMVPYLKEMGMVNMFTNEANFSSISDSPLKVDDVLQKAFIEINEEGSEAAAVTGLSMNYILPSYIEPIRKIKVDKPFLYKIVYKFTTIFAGRVVNPLKM